MVHLPTWIPGAITKLLELFRPNHPKLNLEIRQVCFDKKLESLEADFSDYRIDLYIFLYTWAVNKRGVPTTVKDWKLSILADNQRFDGERVEDISKWQQQWKEHNVVHGFPVVGTLDTHSSHFRPSLFSMEFPLRVGFASLFGRQRNL